MQIFRGVAFLEGISYILLLFVAVPVKYLLDDEQYVKLLGLPHGILFMTFVALAIWLKPILNWNWKVFLIVLIASVIPFGTFYIDKKYLRNNG